MMQRKHTLAKNEGKKENQLPSLFSFTLPSDLENDPNKTLVEKWREFLNRKRDETRSSGSPVIAAQNFMRLLMCFQAPTQIYVFHLYIIPHFFDEYSPWATYYMKLLAWFVLINGLANWFCVILYDPSYRKTKDNPYLNVDRAWDNPPDQFIPQIELANNQNGHCVYDMTSKEGLPWDFCHKCAVHVPPRAYHCNFCKTCILKRDHHCFMVGNCIGFKNQRYFIVLAFYAMVTGAVGGYFTIKYVQEIYWPYCDSWLDILFPVAIFKSIFGSTRALDALLVFHCYLEILFGFIGFVYFTSQMTMSADGKTLFEVAKKVPIKNTNTINRNLKSVFGDFWALNFLFPMVLIFRQRDDGVHWEGVKVDHNRNEWKDDEEVI